MRKLIVAVLIVVALAVAADFAAAAYAEHARLDFVRDVRIVPAALGQDAGLIGAAALILAGDRYWSAD